MPDHIAHLRLVSIPVADVDRAKAFYVDVLGFEERFDGPFGEGIPDDQFGGPDSTRPTRTARSRRSASAAWSSPAR